jgi:hypothetical protein
MLNMYKERIRSEVLWSLREEVMNHMGQEVEAKAGSLAYECC